MSLLHRAQVEDTYFHEAATATTIDSPSDLLTDPFMDSILEAGGLYTTVSDRTRSSSDARFIPESLRYADKPLPLESQAPDHFDFPLFTQDPVDATGFDEPTSSEPLTLPVIDPPTSISGDQDNLTQGMSES